MSQGWTLYISILTIANILAWDMAAIHEMFSSLLKFIDAVVQFFFGDSGLANWHRFLDMIHTEGKNGCCFLFFEMECRQNFFRFNDLLLITGRGKGTTRQNIVITYQAILQNQTISL